MPRYWQGLPQTIECKGAGTPSPRACIFSGENAVCKDSYKRQCRRNRLLRSLPTLASARILTDSVFYRENKRAWAPGCRRSPARLPGPRVVGAVQQPPGQPAAAKTTHHLELVEVGRLVGADVQRDLQSSVQLERPGRALLSQCTWMPTLVNLLTPFLRLDPDKVEKKGDE